MNAAVMTTKNEADIIERCILHLLAEGIDQIYVADASSDDTGLILREYDRVQLYRDVGPHTDQAGWTNRLIADAAADGADWILPVDADEFPRSLTGGTVCDALWRTMGRLLVIDVYDHLNDERRYFDLRHQKVAFRYERGAKVSVGSHRAILPSSPCPVAGVLEIRERCYRSFEHFCRKARERAADLSPEYRQMGWGGHHARLEGWSDDELAEEWERLAHRATVHDPINCPSVVRPQA